MDKLEGQLARRFQNYCLGIRLWKMRETTKRSMRTARDLNDS